MNQCVYPRPAIVKNYFCTLPLDEINPPPAHLFFLLLLVSSRKKTSLPRYHNPQLLPKPLQTPLQGAKMEDVQESLIQKTSIVAVRF